MKESTPGLPDETLRQLQLASELAITSDLLSVVFSELGTEEDIDRWHVVDPRFEKPSIKLRGFDVSDMLYQFAQRTSELQVTASHLDEYVDEDGVYPPTRMWEVFPPKGSSFMGGGFSSSCNQGADLPGIGLTVCVPILKENLDPAQLEFLRESGFLGVDLLQYSSGNEGAIHDLQKPERVFMRIIERDPVASLEVANWVLKSLLTAREMHPEKVSFRL